MMATQTPLGPPFTVDSPSTVRHSSQSDSDRTVDGQEELRRRRNKELDQNAPSDKHMSKAAMITTATPAAGAAGREAMLDSADTRPNGWQKVEIPDKHSLFSPAIRSERNQAIKVGQHLTLLTYRKG